MKSDRFDPTIERLISDWDFSSTFEFFNENAVKQSKQLEFCVYLADLGLLEELHQFIKKNGLYDLKSIAENPENKYEKRDNAKNLLNIYELEMLPVFEREPNSLPGIDGDLIRLSQYSDLSILINYILKNKDIIFQVDQHPKTLMYLTYAISKALNFKADIDLLKLLIDNFDNFKKISALRKAYLTKTIALQLILEPNVITFPKIGHNKLQTLLAILVSQKEKYKGAELFYSLVSDVVRQELKQLVKARQLGSDIRPRVAVCISGMYRCGNLALDNIYKNIIAPLHADVFFHSWTEMQDWPGLGGAGDEWILRIFNKEILERCPHPLRSKKFFKEKFPRTYSIIDTPSYSNFDVTLLPKNIEFKKIQLEIPESVFSENNIREEKFLSLGSLNQAKMLYGIYKAHELAVNYESEKNFRYDYIVRCRPDVGIYNQLNFSDLEKLKTREVAMEFNKAIGAQDQFWYSQRGAGLSIASLWAASTDNGGLSPFSQFPQMRAHGLLLGWMIQNELQPVLTQIRRNMAMVSAKATPPDFSLALAEDFTKEAFDLSQSLDVRKFFTALLEYNRQ